MYKRQFFGKTVEDAISLALKQFASEKSKMETPYASELLSVWLDDKISNPLKPLRPRSLKEIRKMANVFKKQFGTMRIAEINAQYVEHFIKGKAVSNRSRKNILSYLSQFFNWAIKKQHITISNPAKHIEITVTTGTPQFFTVEQCEEILSKVSGNVVMPYFAICLFAGVRPDEAKRMTWGNINLKSNEISLPASITKTKRPRLFEMEPNLVEWLKKANKEEPLIAVNLRKLSAKALLGLSFDWIQDGMRHSFATFYHAKPNSSLDDLRKIMGNSPSVIEKFYKGTITKSEVEKFWNITPDSIQKKEACSNASAGA